jgi:general L-amino acid transport system permease protein
MATRVSQQQTRLPSTSAVIIDWLRQNLFSSWFNSIISVVLLVLVVQIVTSFGRWVVQTQGWPAAFTNLKLLFTWTYPIDQLWRPQLAVGIIALQLGLSAGTWRGIVRGIAIGFIGIMVVLGLLAFLLPPPVPGQVALPAWALLLGSGAVTGGAYFLGRTGGERLRWPLLIAWFLLYPAVVLLIRGGFAGLTLVNTNLWGGLLLTLLLSVSGIVLSFPLGVLLALGRRSEFPVIKVFCIAYIELIRGVPLITVLFMGSLLLPLFMPGGERVDQLVRAMVAVTLFSAAYLAENVRGGLQSLPNGQTEAARALGLNTVQTTLLITLPQALRAVIPVLVGQFISLFKDTSLVVIIGLVDLLGSAQNIVGQPQWLGTPGGVWREVFLVIAAIYWIFSFTMSRSSKRIEENLNVAHR